MKKITIFLSFVFIAFLSNAQLKITFEDAEIGTAGGAVPVWSAGTVDVAANAYTTGNASAKVLHVQNNDYLGIYFNNVVLPANAATVYSKLRVKYLIIGGDDKDYPSLKIYSSPNNWTMSDAEKIGELGWSSLWGAAEIGVWKTVEFSFSAALINPTPAGNLILCLTKSKTEYLIDDIELVAYTPDAPVVTVANFEDKNTGDAVSYVNYWSRTEAAGGTCVVDVNPESSTVNTKSLKITPNNYNGVVALNVNLPAGKTLKNYDKLIFDVYTLSSMYAQIRITAEDSIIYKTPSGYPAVGAVATWITKEIDLTVPDFPATTSKSLPDLNSFLLRIGYTSNNSIVYYLDNIKLRQITASNSNINADNVLIYTRVGDVLNFKNEITTLNIIDLNGKQLLKFTDVNSINLNGLHKGVYILRAEIKGEKFILKIIK